MGGSEANIAKSADARRDAGDARSRDERSRSPVSRMPLSDGLFPTKARVPRIPDCFDPVVATRSKAGEGSVLHKVAPGQRRNGAYEEVNYCAVSEVTRSPPVSADNGTFLLARAGSGSVFFLCVCVSTGF